MAINSKLQREIIAFLTPLPAFHDKEARRAILFTAGLQEITYVLDLSGSAAQFIPLLIAATIGVISPSGNEVGPFLAIEQAALAEQAPAGRRTALFAWYNLAGSFATALGSLASSAGPLPGLNRSIAALALTVPTASRLTRRAVAKYFSINSGDKFSASPRFVNPYSARLSASRLE